MREARVGGACLVGLLSGLLFAGGCGAKSAQQPPPEQAEQAAKAASWVAGCRLQGCSYGAFCNEQGFCESRKCSEGCPANTVCNEGMGLCQSPPPPPKQGDILPQDDKIRNPPTVH